jgi:hypothetical protein
MAATVVPNRVFRERFLRRLRAAAEGAFRY